MEHMPTHPYYLILVVYKNSLNTPSLSHPCGVQELIEYEDNSSHCSRVLCCCFLFVSVDETLKIKTHTLIQTNTQILGLRHIHTDINTHTHTHTHTHRGKYRGIYSFKLLTKMPLSQVNHGKRLYISYYLEDMLNHESILLNNNFS